MTVSAQRPESAAIEFWFDFSSGYAYLAAQEIDQLGRDVGRHVLWRPFMLGAAFKVTRTSGLSSTPLKSDYARRDWARAARKLGLEMRLRERPSVALPATRAFYWLETHVPGQEKHFAAMVFREYFGGRLDTADSAAVMNLAGEFGAAPDAIASGIADPELKLRVRQLSEEAIARGIFGSPFFFVDGEPFWGWDRIPMMREWLTSGGW